jgi:hypothetical protein
MDTNPTVTSARIIPWENGLWGVEITYNDQRRTAYFLGPLAEAEARSSGSRLIRDTH